MTRASASVVEARGSFGFLPLPRFSSRSPALLLDLGERRLRRFHACVTLTRGPLFGGLNALIARIRTRIDLPLEAFHYCLSLCQMPIERRLAPERGGSRTGPDPHAILRQRLEIDETGLCQRRQMFTEQPVEQVGATDPEVRQRVVVHRHSATQPTIGVMARAQSFQGACAADTLAGAIQPQRQQKPWRCRRMPGALAPGLDPVLQVTQIEPFDVTPDQPNRVIFSDQALDIHRPQRDLIASGFTQPRRAQRRRFGLRLRMLRQVAKQVVYGHHRLPRL